MAPDPTLSRRELLRLGLVGGAATFAAACGWEGGPLVPGLRAVSRLNDWVGQHVLMSSRRLAPTYPVSERTPELAFPAYARTRGFPRLDEPAAWRLEVGGLTRRTLRLDLRELRALPAISYTVKHHCVEGWTAIGTWIGPPLATVLAMAEPLPEARYLRFESFDAGYSNGWDLESALHPQTILAWAFNDRPLSVARGWPLRLYAPIKLGYKMTKYLTRIELTATRPGGYWEDRGYPWFAGI